MNTAELINKSLENIFIGALYENNLKQAAQIATQMNQTIKISPENLNACANLAKKFIVDKNTNGTFLLTIYLEIFNSSENVAMTAIVQFIRRVIGDSNIFSIFLNECQNEKLIAYLNNSANNCSTNNCSTNNDSTNVKSPCQVKKERRRKLYTSGLMESDYYTQVPSRVEKNKTTFYRQANKIPFAEEVETFDKKKLNPVVIVPSIDYLKHKLQIILDGCKGEQCDIYYSMLSKNLKKIVSEATVKNNLLPELCRQYLAGCHNTVMLSHLVEFIPKNQDGLSMIICIINDKMFELCSSGGDMTFYKKMYNNFIGLVTLDLDASELFHPSTFNY